MYTFSKQKQRRNEKIILLALQETYADIFFFAESSLKRSRAENITTLILYWIDDDILSSTQRTKQTSVYICLRQKLFEFFQIIENWSLFLFQNEQQRILQMALYLIIKEARPDCLEKL